MPVPNPVAADSTSLSDLIWVNDVRNRLRDRPKPTNASWTADGVGGYMGFGSSPLALPLGPIYDGTPISQFVKVRDTTVSPALDYTVLTTQATPLIAPLGQGNSPVLTDGGAGTFAAGVYQAYYTYVVSGVEQGPFSPPSNALTIVGSHAISLAAITGLPATVTAINVYLYSVTAAANIGFSQAVTVTAGATSPVAALAVPATTKQVVLVDPDTQTFAFGTAPTSGDVIAFGYYSVKWTDAAITAALYAGLRQMFPSVGKTYVDTSLSLSVNTWDYTLPSWASSPDAQISKVEIRTLNLSVEPWRVLYNWTRVGTTQLHIPEANAYPPGTTLRITGWGGYQTLGDLEPDLYNLPIWYAGSVLLPWQESYRVRQDTMVPLTQEGGQQPGLLTQTGNYYQKRFDDELKQKKRAYGPPGASRNMTTTYQVARHV